MLFGLAELQHTHILGVLTNKLLFNGHNQKDEKQKIELYLQGAVLLPFYWKGEKR